MNYEQTNNWQRFAADFMAHTVAQSRIKADGKGHYLLEGKRVTASELCAMLLPADLEALRQKAELFHVTLIKYKLQSARFGASVLN